MKRLSLEELNDMVAEALGQGEGEKGGILKRLLSLARRRRGTKEEK